MKIMIIDIETNGYNNIIEIGAYKLDEDLNVLDTYHHYYYASEKKYNPMATAKTKLTKKALAFHINKQVKDYEEKHNTKKGYPFYFEYDKKFKDFMSDVTHVVAHNISYENRFLDLKSMEHFCTMKNNKSNIEALDKNGNIKNPNLKETCVFYNIDFDDNQYHSAIYDCSVTLNIIQKMYEINDSSLLTFINKLDREQLNFDFGEM